MESVIFDGKEFVKASVLAEKFAYTQDYLGQLCRGKKVDARLVGRAWHINLDSLLSHRTARYKSPAKEIQLESKKTPNHYLSRIDVEPILKQKTVKILRNEAGKLTEFPVKYVGDDYSLIPHVNKSAISSYLHIEPAEAEKITVHKERNTVSITNFKPEPRPEFVLSGRLAVEGIPEETEETPTSAPEPAMEAQIPLTESLTAPPRPIRSLKIRKLARPIPTSSEITRPRPLSVPQKLVPAGTPMKSGLDSTAIPNRPANFAPASITRASQPESKQTNSLALPLLAVAVGFVSGFFILVTEVLIEVNQVSHTDTFIIKIENLQSAGGVILSKIR